MVNHISYKPSGIDWIGEIPSHWETVQPKYRLNRVTRPIDEQDEVVTCFRDGVVTLRKNRREDGFTNSIKEHGYQQIQPGDLVVHEMDGFAGAIGISDSKGKSTPVYTVIEPDGRADLGYVAYLLREMSRSGKIESLARSIRERTTDFRWNMWSVINFPFPPIEEQNRISRYLDKKTSQIDSLISKIEKKIELLKEQRTSLINHYVTKGLDPNVEMKHSGVEWIGEIPKHWRVSRIKYERSKEKYSLVDGPFGSDLKSEHFVDNGDVFVIESGFVTKGSFQQTREFKTISKDHFEKIRRSECFEGDIIIAKIGEYYGMSSILPNLGRETVISGNSCRLKISSENNVKFFHSVLLNLRYQGVIQREVNQTGQPFISLGVIDNLHVFVPPLKEQREIVEHMSKTTSNIDKAITLTTKKMELLSEYRQSLISNVVTGKVRVTEKMI